MSRILSPQTAAPVAADHLYDDGVVAALGLSAAEASRLALALVADADSAAHLASSLLSRRAATIHDAARTEAYVAASPVYEGGELVFDYAPSELAENCLELVAALQIIASGRACCFYEAA